MSSADLVRSSRDGDQFHYYWAARQCLKLLLPGSGLAAVSIEGSAPEDPMAADGQGPDADPTGEYVVYNAEYYGDAAPDAADKIVYRQLKHSTVRPDQSWTASGLKNTLEGFARRFSALGDASPRLRERVSFEFVSNRPVDDAVIRALSDIGQGPARPTPGKPVTSGTAWGCRRTWRDSSVGSSQSMRAPRRCCSWPSCSARTSAPSFPRLRTTVRCG